MCVCGGGRETDRERDRQTERERDRQRQRERERQKTHAQVMGYKNGKTKKEKFISYFILPLQTEMGTE